MKSEGTDRTGAGDQGPMGGLDWGRAFDRHAVVIEIDRARWMAEASEAADADRAEFVAAIEGTQETEEVE